MRCHASQPERSGERDNQHRGRRGSNILPEHYCGHARNRTGEAGEKPRETIGKFDRNRVSPEQSNAGTKRCGDQQAEVKRLDEPLQAGIVPQCLRPFPACARRALLKPGNGLQWPEPSGAGDGKRGFLLLVGLRHRNGPGCSRLRDGHGLRLHCVICGVRCHCGRAQHEDWHRCAHRQLLGNAPEHPPTDP